MRAAGFRFARLSRTCAGLRQATAPPGGKRRKLWAEALDREEQMSFSGGVPHGALGPTCWPLDFGFSLRRLQPSRQVFDRVRPANLEPLDRRLLPGPVRAGVQLVQFLRRFRPGDVFPASLIFC
jgi:hypothetical protein